MLQKKNGSRLKTEYPHGLSPALQWLLVCSIDEDLNIIKMVSSLHAINHLSGHMTLFIEYLQSALLNTKLWGASLVAQRINTKLWEAAIKGEIR